MTAPSASGPPAPGRQGGVSSADRFERLFIAEYQRVVAIAQRILGDAHEAEDVAQEVFVAYHLRGLPESGHVPAWLWAAGAHTALNRLRGLRRRGRREVADALASEPLRTAQEASLDPQRIAEQAEQRRAVRTALGRLPAQTAALLVLRHSGLSYVEIAAALGIKVDQVGTRLRRAELTFRKEIHL
jgi:RNA polymerase sigma-70 factor (ECF subfamily)